MEIFIFLFIPGAILLFLLFRSVILWYWRINEIVNLLEDIKNELKKHKEIN